MPSSPNLPSELLQEWQHCGLRVRGIWHLGRVKAWTSRHSDHWQLLTVHQGSVRVNSALGEFLIPGSAVMLSAPGMVCQMEPEPETVTLDILFSAVPTTGRSVPWSMINLPLLVPDAADEGFLALAQGMGEGSWSDLDAALEARFRLDRYLLHLFREASRLGLLRGFRSRPAWLRDAVQAADRRLSDPGFQGKAFAALAGCSVVHLNRSIQSSYGCSSRSLLRRLRIERAAHLMQQDAQIRSEDVARLCGFTGVRQFREQWLKQTGGGLRAFRKQQQVQKNP